MNSQMPVAGALLTAVAAAIAATWAWLGSAVQMPPSPLAPGEKVHCISYAPFRGNESPLDAGTTVEPAQIDQDLAQLKASTDCVRTYSVDQGLDRIAEIAQRHGLKVLQGLWLSSLRERNRSQVERSIALARQYPDVIAAVIVGNEVLLRGEMSSLELAATIREVKAKVSVPVTYADVWEFWLRYREIAPEVDFITIHILPYWEDFPIAAEHAAAHVEAIRTRVAAAFPGKEILVGEFGWPSAGRMRAGALPSPVNQARTMHDVLSLAKREHYRVNLIEAYDQPWKRELEGTVGGHWGLFDAYSRTAKFAWGGLVSDHPARWRQAAGGIALAAVVFAAAWVCRRPPKPTPRLWPQVALIAVASGGLAGWTLANIALESLTAGDWLCNLAWAGVAIFAPVLGAAALASGRAVPSFAHILNRRVSGDVLPLSGLELALGSVLIVLAVLCVQAALGLVFDPRYRDFPFAPLTGAAVPFLVLAQWRLRVALPAAELAIAVLLAGAAIYIVLNEGFANWQACWLAAGLGAAALILVRAPAAPS